MEHGGPEFIKLMNLYELQQAYMNELTGLNEDDPLYQSLMTSLNSVNQQIALQLPIAEMEAASLSSSFIGSEMTLQSLIAESMQTTYIIQQLDKKTEQYEYEIDALEKSKVSTVLGKIDEGNKYIAELTLQIKKVDDHIEKCRLIAPASGTLSNVSPWSEGQTVSGEQVAITLIPDEEENIIECMIENNKMTNVILGQEVAIKLDAYPYSRYGIMNGEIIYISPEAYTLENQVPSFKVQIKIDNSSIGKNAEISAGMSGTIEIKTGTRNILAYFLEPIIEGLDNSLKEV